MKDDLDCSMLEASEAPLPRVPVHLPLPLSRPITVYDLMCVFMFGLAGGLLMAVVLFADAT